MVQTWIVGNWKMHLRAGSAARLSEDIAREARSLAHDAMGCAICPPFPYIPLCAEKLKESPVQTGAQDCSLKDEDGAFTGEVSASMLKDLGCGLVIVGHSERRQHFTDSSERVREKAEYALNAGLMPIICVGEPVSVRQKGAQAAIDYVVGQARDSLPQIPGQSVILAYEPVWAIGTGQNAEIDDIAEMHEFLKKYLENYGITHILYGGSVKPENASEILALHSVGGALIGGASLKADQFSEILQMARHAVTAKG